MTYKNVVCIVLQGFDAVLIMDSNNAANKNIACTFATKVFLKRCLNRDIGGNTRY